MTALGAAIAAHVVLDSRFRENDGPGESAIAGMLYWIPVSPSRHSRCRVNDDLGHENDEIVVFFVGTHRDLSLSVNEEYQKCVIPER